MKKVSAVENEGYKTLKRSKIIHLNTNQRANFMPFCIQNRLCGQKHSLKVKNRIVFDYGVNDACNLSGNNDQSLFRSFALRNLFMVKILKSRIVFDGSNSSEIESSSGDRRTLFGHFRMSFSGFSGRRDRGKQAQRTDESRGGREAGNIAHFADDGGNGFRTDSRNSIEIANKRIRRLIGRIKDGIDFLIKIRDMNFKLLNLSCKHSNRDRSGRISLTGRNTFLRSFNKAFKERFIKMVSLNLSGNGREIFKFGIRKSFGSREILQDEQRDNAKRMLDKLKIFRKHYIEKGKGLSFVVLKVFQKCRSKSDKLSDSLNSFIGNVGRFSFAGAEKSSDGEGVDIIGFNLLADSFPKPVSLEGIKQNRRETFGGEKFKEVFPKIAGSFHSNDKFFGIGRKSGEFTQERGETQKRRLKGEGRTSLLAIGVENTAAMGFFSDINTDKKHKSRSFQKYEKAVQAVSDKVSTKIACEKISDVQERTHNILNESFKVECQEATVFQKLSHMGNKEIDKWSSCFPFHLFNFNINTINYRTKFIKPKFHMAIVPV